MSTTAKMTRKMEELARERNRDVVGDVVSKVVLGLLLTLFTFGFIFVFAAVLLSPLGRMAGWSAWHVGLAMAGLFLLVAAWSAWRNVDPLREAGPISESDEAQFLVGAAIGLPMFRPRHTVAGFAMVLIGGPASIFEGLGLWASRLPLDAAIIAEAARILPACEERCPLATIRHTRAAELLYRLGLVKMAEGGGALTCTDRGYKLLKGKNAKASG